MPSTLASGLSNENLGDEFGAFAEDQILANGSTLGQVSERHGEKKALTNIDVISASWITKILLEEPTRHLIRGTRTSSVTST